MLFKSQDTIKQLLTRKNKNLKQLEILENKPKSQAEKKGQLTESLRISELDRDKYLSLIHI